MTRPSRPRGSALRAFLRSEAAGGIVLMAAALAALIVANSPLADGYGTMLSAKVGPLSTLHWINDGLMALFFLLVGCEIKRELVAGELADPADRRLPVIAAAAGMIVPALIYLAVVRDTSLARGWAIPAATDIAFAIGVIALLDKRVPASLKLFLTTVAIVDDMGAVIIIAVAYSHGLNLPALAGGSRRAGDHGGVEPARRLAPRPLSGCRRSALVAGADLGRPCTVAGVLAAAFIPVTRSRGTPDAAESPLHRLEHALNPWVAFAIVPLFGFANAGVSLVGVKLTAPLVVAISAGLFVGKQVGILGGIMAAERLGLARRPARVSWAQLHGVALLAGIGFTMSLFIGGLAFPGRPDLIADVKIGVLAGSLLSAVAGYAVLRWAAKQ